MANRLYAYRPGLDGIRGIGMVIFMFWHVGALTQLKGLWVYMNVFFILSAFLITRLLLAEYQRFGSISVKDFYIRRVRRLLPALLIMLGFVTLDGLFFAPASTKTYLRGDILSSLGYVMNWRLVMRHDQYFEDFTVPSMTRHAWSLSVEEQFYLVVPWLIIGVLMFVRSRASRTAVFAVIAVLSALWSMTIDMSSLSGQAHAYYGTDVRMQSLALGVALGMWTGHRDAGPELLRPNDPDDVVDSPRSALPELLGWAGMAALAISFFRIEPLAPWMFGKGGMLLTSIAGCAYVIGCAQRLPTPLVVLHASKPVRYTGRISYGLYLYHWPIFLVLNRHFSSWGIWPLAVITLGLSYLAAGLSYRYIEQPIIRHGLAAFGIARKRVVSSVGAAGLVGIIGGASLISGGAIANAADESDPSVAQYVAHIPDLVAGQQTYHKPARAVHIALFGDSVPFFLAKELPHQNFPNLDVENLGTPGCDILDAPVQWTSDQQQVNDGPCKQAKATYLQKFQASGATTFVMMPSLYLALRHNLNGHVVWLNDKSYVDLIRTTLTRIANQAREHGAKQVLTTTIPCRQVDELMIPPQYRSALASSQAIVNEAQTPKRVNALIASWAKANHVGVVDLGSAVCGTKYQPVVHGIKLYDDGIHFSPKAAPMVWGWLAPQIVSKAEKS